MTDKRSVVLNFVSGCILLLVFFSLIATGLMMFWPVKVLDVVSLVVERKTYYSNDTVPVELTVVKYVDLPAAVNISIVDGIRYTLSERTTNNPPGCTKVTAMSVQIPPTIPSGEYFIRYIFTYQVNPLREVSVTAESNKFNVIQK